MSLMEDEKILRDSMDPQVNAVLSGKRLKLFEQIFGCLKNLLLGSG